MATLKEQIIEAAGRNKGKTVAVKAWGVDAHIRVMSGTERDAFEAAIFTDGKMNKEKFRSRLLVKTLADAEGKRVFDEADINQLSEMDSIELDRLYTLAAKTNALSKSDVDELTKNS